MKTTISCAIALLLTLFSNISFSQDDWKLNGNGTEANGAVLGTNEMLPLNFVTNENINMTLDAKGKLGVGTQTPKYEITIHGTGLARSNASHLSSNSNGSIGSTQGASSDTESTIQLTNSESGMGLNRGLLLSLVGDNASLNSPTAERMKFQAGSSFFTLNDDRTLDLFGSSAVSSGRLNLFTGTDNGMYVKKSSTGYSLKLVNYNDNADAIQIASTDSPTAINFVVKQDGRTGIGTDSPDSEYMLDVAGKVRACEIKVSNPGWCDYVFEDDYDLMSLKDLRNFISTNGHLPNVPSSQEVEANGIELAQMNAILLRKIEELTLHLLEQNKEIEELKLQLND